MCVMVYNSMKNVVGETCTYRRVGLSLQKPICNVIKGWEGVLGVIALTKLPNFHLKVPKNMLLRASSQIQSTVKANPILKYAVKYEVLLNLTLRKRAEKCKSKVRVEPWLTNPMIQLAHQNLQSIMHFEVCPCPILFSIIKEDVTHIQVASEPITLGKSFGRFDMLPHVTKGVLPLGFKCTYYSLWL